MNWAKSYVAKETNLDRRHGSLSEMLKDADVFIGVSTGNIVTEDDIAGMAPDAIVFALAIPTPEVDPAAARAAGARVVATGRSDYANTMDISLVFPGVFRGLLDCRAHNIRLRTLVAAAHALADMVKPDELHADYIVPNIFDFRVAPNVAAAVVRATVEAGEAGRIVSPEEVAESTLRYVYEGRRRPIVVDELDNARHSGIDRSSPPAWRRARDPEQDPDPRSSHPESDLRAARRPRTGRASFATIPPRSPSSPRRAIWSPSSPMARPCSGWAISARKPRCRSWKAKPSSSARWPASRPSRSVWPRAMPDEIVRHVRTIAPSFGGINLEDISAPRCFEIERRLRLELDMPVFHDDQHGTAIIVGAALLNAAKLRGTPLDELHVTINGGGAAGIAVTKLLLALGIRDIVVCDRAGAIYHGRTEHMDFSKLEIAELTNPEMRTGALAEVIRRLRCRSSGSLLPAC